MYKGFSKEKNDYSSFIACNRHINSDIQTKYYFMTITKDYKHIEHTIINPDRYIYAICAPKICTKNDYKVLFFIPIIVLLYLPDMSKISNQLWIWG